MKFSRTATVIAGAAVIAVVGAAGVATADHNNDHLVNTKDIRDHTVKRWDLGRHQVGWNKLTTIVQDRVEDGSSYEVVGRGTDEVEVVDKATIVSKCAEGDQVLSGGVKGGNVVVKESYPSDIKRVGPDTEENPSGLWAATSWTSVVEGSGMVQPYLICADVN